MRSWWTYSLYIARWPARGSYRPISHTKSCACNMPSTRRKSAPIADPHPLSKAALHFPSPVTQSPPIQLSSHPPETNHEDRHPLPSHITYASPPAPEPPSPSPNRYSHPTPRPPAHTPPRSPLVSGTTHVRPPRWVPRRRGAG